MKILFAGTPDFAVKPLQNLIDSGAEIVGVLTQADKPQGRKGVLTPPPVKTLAQKYNLRILQPERLRENLNDLRSLRADIMITCAYGQILTQEVLDLFPKGVWNIHAGLLPQYRGASPIQNCILQGETITGVSIMRTELGLDSGAVLSVKTTEILEYESYGELSERLSQIGAELLKEILPKLNNGRYSLKPQEKKGAQVFRKINKNQAKISFAKTAREVVNLVRGMNPAPIAYAEIEGNILNVYRAEVAALTVDEVELCKKARFGEVLSDKPKRGLLVKCKDGAVKLVEVQAAGGKRMSGGDFLNGRKIVKGQVFSC